MDVLSEIGFGVRYHGLTWNDFDVSVSPEAQAKRDACLLYANSFETALKNGDNGLLYGSPGTGKTMLTALIAGAVKKSGHDVLRLSAWKAVSPVRCGDNVGVNIWIPFLKPDLLIIDNFDMSRQTPEEKDFLFEVIFDRYDECRPTIVIADTNREKSIYANDIRLFRFMNTCTLMEDMTWPSYRRRHLKNNC